MDNSNGPPVEATDGRFMNEEELDSGLVNLVMYYKNLFEVEENTMYYSQDDYQRAKRKFVKFQLKERLM